MQGHLGHLLCRSNAGLLTTKAARIRHSSTHSAVSDAVPPPTAPSLAFSLPACRTDSDHPRTISGRDIRPARGTSRRRLAHDRYLPAHLLRELRRVGHNKGPIVDAPVRGTWDAAVQLLKDVSNQRAADDKGRQRLEVANSPRTAKQRAFAAAVRSIIRRPRLLYKEREQSPALTQKCQSLVDFFDLPDLEEHLSQQAVNDIIHFLTRHARTRDRSRIIQILGRRNIPFFDSIVYLVIRQSHPNSLVAMLSSMRTTDFQPDKRTVTALIRVAAGFSPKIANHVAHYFRRHFELRDTASVRAMTSVLVPHDIYRWIQDNPEREISAFLEHYDRRWRRKDWFSGTAVARMAQILAHLGRHGDLRSLFDATKQRGSSIGRFALNNALSPAVARGNVQAVVSIMSTCFAAGSRADAGTYKMLFKLVWDRRYINMLRVVWFHACLSGHVSSQMERKMKAAVLCNIPRRDLDDVRYDLASAHHRASDACHNTYRHPMRAAAESRSTHFRSVGSKVAIDLLCNHILRIRAATAFDEGGDQPSPSIAAPDECAEAPGFSDTQGEGSPFEVRWHSLIGLIQADTQLAGLCKPLHSLAHDLKIAYKLDRQWKMRRLTTDLNTMLMERYVPMVDPRSNTPQMQRQRMAITVPGSTQRVIEHTIAQDKLRSVEIQSDIIEVANPRETNISLPKIQYAYYPDYLSERSRMSKNENYSPSAQHGLVDARPVAIQPREPTPDTAKAVTGESRRIKKVLSSELPGDYGIRDRSGPPPG